MITHTKVLRLIGMIGVTLWLAGCGESGSQPVLFPEIQFVVGLAPCEVGQPCPAQAQVMAELEVGGVSHKVPSPLLVTSNFQLLAENAAPPYAGKFTLVPPQQAGAPVRDVQVKLIVTGQTTQTGFSSGVGVPAIVGAFTGTLPPPAEEVRFDVCVPLLTPGTCFGAGDSGVFGVPFQGTIGDAAQTHLLSTAVPSIFFLENAVDTVNGIFTLIPFTGQELVAQLFINGAFKQTQSGTHDVIIRQDL